MTDRRVLFARPDLADARLEGEVDATRFAEPEARIVTAPVLSMRGRPDDDAGIETQFLFGEAVSVLDVRDGWAWAQGFDGYVGYVLASGLGEPAGAATHRVTARFAHLYPDAPDGPSMKRPPIARVPLGARLVAAGEPYTLQGAGGKAIPLAGGGWLYEAHIAPLDEPAADFVSVAEAFLGTPYLWGGRSSEGIDCSGLVQIALGQAGTDSPRDADMQEGRADGVDGVGAKLEHSTLARGDLVFWPGHVGIMQDAETLLHANAHHMMVVSEPLPNALRRFEAAGVALRTVRRPTAPR